MEGEGEGCLWLTEVVTERSWNTRITLHFFAITLPHFLLGTLPGTIANGSVILPIETLGLIGIETLDTLVVPGG